MIEPLLMCTTHLRTFNGESPLTQASGFFFQRGGKIYVITSRHVLFDEPTQHFPDRLLLQFHTDPDNIAEATELMVPLYEQKQALWRDARDGAGPVDVAAIEIGSGLLPSNATFNAFTESHLLPAEEQVEVGSLLLIVGFPLGFHDTLHHLPVVRQAGLASSFGFRFKGEGYFLTDGRTHRGSSGAPVVMKTSASSGSDHLPWRLLGIHSSRLDLPSRDQTLDEALGLNCAWYADIILTLTE